MCTVSYIPIDNGFFLTSNRDEDPLRETTKPQDITIENGLNIFAPVDKEKGGSWIATDSKTRIACLLNGAFNKHERVLPYRKSRGCFVFEAFQYATFLDFMEKVDLHNIEPFTLILVDKSLQVLVWDGVKKHMQFLSKTIPHLWSSSTLYTKDIHEEKLEIFNKFLDEEAINSKTILNLHGLTSKNQFVLDRPEVKTVSITQIQAIDNKMEMVYYNKAKTNEKQEILY